MWEEIRLFYFDSRRRYLANRFCQKEFSRLPKNFTEIFERLRIFLSSSLIFILGKTWSKLYPRYASLFLSLFSFFFSHFLLYYTFFLILFLTTQIFLLTPFRKWGERVAREWGDSYSIKNVPSIFSFLLWRMIEVRKMFSPLCEDMKVCIHQRRNWAIRAVYINNTPNEC